MSDMHWLIKIKLVLGGLGARLVSCVSDHLFTNAVCVITKKFYRLNNSAETSYYQPWYLYWLDQSE